VAPAPLLRPMAAPNFVSHRPYRCCGPSAGSLPTSGLPIRGPLLGWPVVLVPRRAGSREMFQKDSFSVHELSFGAIIFREKGI
jgi:hypothetical protein